MDEIGEIDDREIERLLSGRISAGAEAPDLVRFLSDFDATHPEPSIAHCEGAHLSAIFAAARQLAETDPPFRGQVRATPESTPRASEPADQGRSWMARRLPKWAGVKLAIPFAVMLFAFGGVALAGGLVYHGASDGGGSPAVTEPAPLDTLLDATGGDDADDSAIVESDSSAITDPRDAAIDESEPGGADRGDADDTASVESERNDRDDPDEAAIEQYDQDDSDDEAVDEDDQEDQEDRDSVALEENEQDEQDEQGGGGEHEDD
jgi:hypothetical protein